jgi:ketosteroid isomerase-like protein
LASSQGSCRVSALIGAWVTGYSRDGRGQRRRVRQWWERFIEEGVPPLDLRAPDIEMSNPPQFPNRGPYRGREGIQRWHADTWEVFTGLRHELGEVIAAGDGETVVSVQRTEGRMRHIDLPMNAQWAAVWTVRGGRALRVRGYMTRAQAVAATGLPEGVDVEQRG